MIRILDKVTSDKIAAGEVIERPISIVKELIENSIDAGADQIVCEIKNGGKTYIRVSDNGCGIPQAEVETAFLRHATSKIETAKDLASIETLGFRGEALASIAAVTHTELITKTADSKLGTKLLIHGGEVISNESTGCPNGTTIICEDLFYNTPARLKFMKADSTEAAKINEFLSQMALAYKDIRFRFIVNDKIIFSTTGDGNRLNTIIRIFNDVDRKNLVAIEKTDGPISISGYISTPAMSKNNRSGEIFFVNGRVVNSKVIERGINSGYKERLFEGRFPICYLFLEVKADTLDVNIHPNKREVRFDNEGLISDFVSLAIKEALSTRDAVVNAGNLFKESKISGTEVFKRALSSEKTTKSEVRKTDAGDECKNTQINIKELLSTIDNTPKVSDTGFAYEHNAPDLGIDFTPDTVETKKNKIEIYSPMLKPFDFEDIKLSGTIFDTYITAVDDTNFYLIDQHAAQERIFYEKLVSEYDKTEKDRQQLLIPVIINLSIKSAMNKNLWSSPLEDMGFTLEEFGENTYRMSEIPMFMELSEAEDFVKEFIDNISSKADIRNTVVVNKLIMMSCKAAIKAHDKISMAEAEALMKDLSNCINPYSCPHGRPTVIKLSQYDIEKMFKRIQ